MEQRHRRDLAARLGLPFQLPAPQVRATGPAGESGLEVRWLTEVELSEQAVALMEGDS